MAAKPIPESYHTVTPCDRFGTTEDPFGHSWSIATHVEDLTPEEIAGRGRAAMAEMSAEG